MTAFTDHSIDLMETIADESDKQINLTRRGYALATRSENTDGLITELMAGYAGADGHQIRSHEKGDGTTYIASIGPGFEGELTFRSSRGR